jgi:SAM-dependent methyltransferase
VISSAVTPAVQDRPSAWVRRFAPLIPTGEVLDLACGSGRHARLLAGLGHAVVAVDRDATALSFAAGPEISTLQADLEAGPLDGGGAWPFEAGRFAGIVVTNYLHRPLLPKIFDSLAPNGVLIYETFSLGNERLGKPSNPLFLLQRGELLNAVTRSGHPLHVLAYEDGYINAAKPAMVQRICVVGVAEPPELEALRLF